ncbi:MAG: DUF2206 domain-containing protein, partial [Methanobacterium paludis]|nr:DUF2206 domain-containing protein [Methanobacterium paludis]
MSVILNIPYLRQITFFILLTFIPGLLVIQILKLNTLDTTTKFCLSVGLSFVLIIFVGMLTNFLPYSKPLNTSNLLIIFNLMLIILMLLGISVNKNHFELKFPKIKLNSYEKSVLIISCLLPTLALLGTYLVQTNHNFIILYIMIFLIPFLVIFITFANKNLNENIYPITIFSISISIVLAYTLISNYIYGSDSHQEFYFFKMVLNSGKWQIFGNTTLLQSGLNSCLSISVLPAVYQLILKIDPTLLFKLIYVLPLSLTPVIVYKISKNYSNAIYSFLAAILIIASVSFYAQTEAYRTYIAIFFFALAIMVFLSPNINDPKSKFLFIIFSVALIISHYSTSYIFVILLLISLILIFILGILIKIKNNSHVSPFYQNFVPENGKFLSIGVFLLVFAMIFLWYSQITGSTFNNGLYYLSNTLGKLNQLFLLESRDPTVYQAMGSTLSNAPLIRYINFFSSWMSIIFIATGLLITFLSILNVKYLKIKLNDICNINIDNEFFSLGASSFLVLVFAVIVPFALVFYSLPRFYYMILVPLSVFFILGGKIISKVLRVKKAYIIILIVLIPLLFSSIGLTPQYLGTPNSILLNSPENINNTFYIHDQEAYGAKWIGNYGDLSKKFYTDTSASERLVSIGLV